MKKAFDALRACHPAVLAGGMVILLIGACSTSDDKSAREPWPSLVDIAPASQDISVSGEHEAVIEALREEARVRKTEGYQPPVAQPPVEADMEADAENAPDTN